VSPGYSYL